MIPATRAKSHLPVMRPMTAMWRADRLELQAVSTVIIGPCRPNHWVTQPARQEARLTAREI